jgi:RNA polymerase sigma-70 factor (ECF subfamily)
LPAGVAPAFSTGLPLAEDETVRQGELRDLIAIAAGDQAAFARMIDREAPRLLRFAQGLLGSLEEAEDVVQETLISFWENSARWRPEARIGTWLHTVCYNRAIDRLRRRRNFVDESALGELPDVSRSVEEQLADSDAARSVQEAVGRLSHRQRSAVLLFHFQELPQREAAEIMGISEAAFESLLARARRRMRQMLAGEFNDE